ncbi:MAG: hypothetical protein JNK87_40540 [Bryobacterales bacterium]|nr:hypothetical protein [Bryobacterales bacterium]
MRFSFLLTLTSALLPAAQVNLNFQANVTGTLGSTALSGTPLKIILTIDDSRITGAEGAQSTHRSGHIRVAFLNNGLRTYRLLTGTAQVAVSNGAITFTQTGGSTLTVVNPALASTDIRVTSLYSINGANANPALTFATSAGTLTINAGAVFTFHNQDPQGDKGSTFGSGAALGPCCTFTNTTKTLTDTTAVTRDVETYSTRITGRLNNGPALYDQTFALPISDPAVQAGITQARAAITTAAAGAPLFFFGPTRTAGTRTSTGTTQQTTNEVLSETTGITISSPASLATGPDGAQILEVADLPPMSVLHADMLTTTTTARTTFTNNNYSTVESYSLEGSTQLSSAPSGMRFVSLTPCRLIETRPEYNFQNRMPPFGPPFFNRNEVRTFNPQLSTVCQVPSSAKAYVLNVTVVPRSGDPIDAVTVFPAGEPRPDYWTVRSPERLILANSAIVKAGAGGAISVFTSEATDLIIDIAGYFTDSPIESNLVYYSMTPCRVIETRLAYRPTPGQFGPPALSAQGTRTFRFPQSPDCNIPPGAAAYSVTLTVVPPAPLPFVTAWPSHIGQPAVSSINSFNGRILANSVIVPASPDGSINLYAFDRTDMIVDINGYFAPDNGTTGLYYFPVTQCRFANTNDAAFAAPNGAPIFENESIRTFTPSPARCGGAPIPATARAYVLNATVIPNGNPMPFLTVWPTGQPRPGASVINAFEGQTVSSGFIVPAGTNGAIDVFAYRRTHVALEISGYFGR